MMLSMIAIFLMYKYIEYVSFEETIKYTLSEISDGVYAEKHSVHSNIPARNTEVVTFCAESQIVSVSGKIYICYTTEKPYVEWTRTNVVHGDTVKLYIPQNSLQIGLSVNANSRQNKILMEK